MQFAGRYTGDNIINTYGSEFSSAATTIGFAVKPKNGLAGFVSSAGNASFKRGAIRISDAFEFLNAPTATVAIGTDVTMTSRFKINALGDITSSGKINGRDILAELDALNAGGGGGITYTVNTFYAELGGYVVKIWDSGKHGLVVAMQDQIKSTFFQVLNTTNTANNHDADGAAVKGWRIPTLNEAALIVKEHANIGGFTANAFYWTSHSMGDLRYIVVQFDTTPIYSHYPSSTYQARSRVVREF